MFTLFGITFAGLGPAAAALVAACGTAALVTLYLLRERRVRVRVAFVALWDVGIGHRRVHRLGRRLRRWLSLLMQLLLLWLLVLALLDPRPVSGAEGARTWLVLVDRSASMRARDGAADRMATARAHVRAIVGAMGARDRAMVAGFAGSPMAESGFEADPRLLEAAIERLVATQEPADAGRALAFAAAVLRGRPLPTVVLVGDGRTELKVPHGLELRFVPVGRAGDNIAILALAARRRPLDPSAVDVSIRVASFTRAPASVAVQFLVGRQARPVEQLTLALAAGERVTRTLQLFTESAELTARLVFPAGTGDLLALDDHAHAVVPARARRRVLVVGQPNLYLEGALLSLGDSASIRRVAPERAEATRGDWTAQDLVIFDGVAPTPAPPAGRYLYLDPHGPGSPFPAGGEVRNPVPSDVDRQHPLLASVSLADLNIRQARRLTLETGDRAVASSLGTPLLVARSRPDLKIVALSFDTRRSDLPLRPTFPLLLANTLEWLAPVGGGSEQARRTGEMARLALDAAVASAIVTTPSGRAERRTPVGGTLEVPLPEQGFYRVAAGDGTRAVVRHIAASLSDVTESDTTLAPMFRGIAAWSPPRSARRRDWATLALVLAAALSLSEWWSHHRRWTV